METIITSPNSNKAPDLFEFLSYREFLKAFYAWRKQEHSWFSYRYVGKKIGIDPGDLVKVMQGQRHITDKHFPGIEKLCSFTEEQMDFFRYLVVFEKAKNQDQIRMAFEKILEFREKSVQNLEADQYEFYNKWYYSAIRSLVDFHPFRGSFRELGQKLSPSISAQEAKEAVSLLKRLELIYEDKEGTLRLSSGAISNGKKWQGIAIQNFQRETLNLAIEAFDRHDISKRDISTMTVSIRQDQMTEFKAITSEYRKKIAQFVAQQSGEDAVYQLNVQFFPLSR